ncbi:hypothetical protein A6R68_09393 [Neotoma lepida]|uniref:Protein FAM24A n=1 Tax=Neotoma lepida TaxID=56216 RepID=A0A1A6FZZ3_NEOLE|nr:hypothetical protein A6R68_09393 [Neotoma lepida]
MSGSFDLRTIITISIGGGILAGMFLLIGVVLCLYSKIAKALNSSRTADEAVAVSCVDPGNQYKVTFDNIIPAKAITTESCPTLQCCDDCTIYTDVGNLPPCFCNISEGL